MLIDKTMKKLFLIITIVFLSGCSQKIDVPSSFSNTQVVVADAPDNPASNLMVIAIKDSLFKGSHAGILACEKCHSSVGGEIKGELIWENENTGKVETIATSTELCVKCHVDQQSHKGTESPTSLAHTNFECTNCHEPHSLQSSCTQSTCHNSIEEIINAQIDQPIIHDTSGDPTSYMCGGTSCHELSKEVANSPIYHQPSHRSVSCFVCHDVSGLPITRTVNQSWITTNKLEQTTSSTSDPVVSHLIGMDVDCSRCHFLKNPWNLKLVPPSN